MTILDLAFSVLVCGRPFSLMLFSSVSLTIMFSSLDIALRRLMSSSGHVSLSLIMKFGRRTGLAFWGSFNNSMSRGIGRMLWAGVDEYRNVCRDS